MKKKDFKCDLCRCRSTSKGGLTSHKRYAHAIYPEVNREVYREEPPLPQPVKEAPTWMKEIGYLLPSLPEVL